MLSIGDGVRFGLGTFVAGIIIAVVASAGALIGQAVVTAVYSAKENETEQEENVATA